MIATKFIIYGENLETYLPIPRQIGKYRGQIQIAEDFDAQLDSFWLIDPSVYLLPENYN